MPSPCLSPCTAFPSPSRSIHFVDVSEVNGRQTPSQKQNAHACVAFETQDAVDVLNSWKQWFFKNPLWIFVGSTFADRL